MDPLVLLFIKFAKLFKILFEPPFKRFSMVNKTFVVLLLGLPFVCLMIIFVSFAITFMILIGELFEPCNKFSIIFKTLLVLFTILFAIFINELFLPPLKKLKKFRS